MIKRINNSGQTLLEVIVALGVVLSVLITIAGLVMINVFGQKASESRIIAGNLAREGIEAMRNIRDTVKLQKTSLEDYIQDGDYSPATHYYLPELNIANGLWTWTLTSPGCDFCNENSRLYVSSDAISKNFYRYYAPGITSIFKRQLVIDPICQNTGECVCGDDGVCESSDNDPIVCSKTICTATIGYRVKSEVQWTENNALVDFKLTDFLYNWQ